MRRCIKLNLAVLLLGTLSAGFLQADEPRALRAGAATVDITPQTFPVIMNGNFFPKQATGTADTLYARGLVLDDGRTKLAIVVVDACMMQRELIDAAKALAAEATGIPTDRMLVSATHTHSSPSGMGCLGTPIDDAYAQFLRGAIADCIKQAAAKLVPAKVGATSVDFWTHTFCRAWIRRPDKMLDDPFGVKNVRANMHPGHESPDVVGPVSPVDPELTLLSVQTTDGKPLALLANYSMHYFGSPAGLLSSDYTGQFCRRIEQELTAKPDADAAAFTVLMSQGTSGDSQWKDYSNPATKPTLEEYTEGLVKAALQAVSSIEHRTDATLAMAESKLTLKRRIPDEARLKWAREKLAALGDRAPKDRAEVYAQEAIYLHDEPERELKLQAVRIGDFGIAAIPNEVFAISGLKIKRQSPLAKMMNIELANGSEGYIPPPYQHPLGGYTTWPARTAALEVQAEPQIVETVVSLLEKVAEKPRRAVVDEHGPYAKAVLESKPAAYWRLNEWSGETAHDASGNGKHAKYVGNVTYYLPGAQVGDAAVATPPQRPSAFSAEQINRAPHFAGGHLAADLTELGSKCSIELWFWLGAEVEQARIFSHGAKNPTTTVQRHFSVSSVERGKPECWLTIDSDRPPNVTPALPATDDVTSGAMTNFSLRRWYHLVVVFDGRDATAYLDGREFHKTTIVEGPVTAEAKYFFGLDSQGESPFEGRLDEIAVYGRALTAEEVAKHYAAAKR